MIPIFLRNEIMSVSELFAFGPQDKLFKLCAYDKCVPKGQKKISVSHKMETVRVAGKKWLLDW